MKDEDYDSLLAVCDGLIASKKELTSAEAAAFPGLTLDQVLAVFRQQYTRHIKRTAHLHRVPATMDRYLAAYAEGTSICEIAEEANFSPYLLARLFVEKLCKVDKKAVGRMVRDPAAHITDARLRDEVAFCVDMDQYCSPFVDRIRMSIGNEYEFLLQRTLANRGLPFETEDQLRARGLSKTPDVLLKVPIGVPGADGTPHVVHWIDSKAMFGDRRVHDTEIAPQLAGYINRFGPGMVIYWFDFVDSLADSDPDVVVVKQFPPLVVSPGCPIPVCDPDFVALLARPTSPSPVAPVPPVPPPPTTTTTVLPTK